MHMEMMKGMSLAPGLAGGGGDGAFEGDGEDEEEEAWTGLRVTWGLEREVLKVEAL